MLPFQCTARFHADLALPLPNTHQIHHQSSPHRHPGVVTRVPDMCMHMYIYISIYGVSEMDTSILSILKCIRVHLLIYIHTYVYIHIFKYKFIMYIYIPQADSPPLQFLGLIAETLSLTNIARLIDVPQFSTTSLVQSRIGNTPVYTYTHAHTHTHARMYMGIYTYIHIFPISEISIERPPQKNCSPSTIIDMLSMRTSGTPRRGNRRSGVQLPLRFGRASS